MKNILLVSLISIAAASASIAPTQAAPIARVGDHAHERHCRIKTVSRWFHHHRVVQKIRVCHPKY
ncbi:hypothetical protein [Mesorhizobium sp.]|uniref:hypothetical protein n=1 Tax=Mesorhizobium sp. TaxID=1871066 RepID=UPI003BAD61D2